MKNAIALGTFDGVHIGHREVLDITGNFRRVAVTFSIPPKAIISGEKQLIMSCEDKRKQLTELGIDEVFLLDFNEVREMSAADFLNLLFEKFNPSVISCGFNYRFGKNGEGDTDTLSEFCVKNGIKFRCCEPVSHNGIPISSTYIRGLLADGEIEQANHLLNRPFSYTSKVIDGDRRGRTIGFPTANQKYPEELVRLRFGVYKTIVTVDGVQYEGITDIGIRPTFKSDYVISETYIKNFSSDIYGKEITITPVKFLRDEKRFYSLEELKKQILEDITR